MDCWRPVVNSRDNTPHPEDREDGRATTAEPQSDAAWPLPRARAFSVLEHEPIRMADGVRLSARLWLPQGDEPVPAVLEYIPYRKRDGYRGHDDLWRPVLAAHGFAYARVDVRGTGDSDGVLTDEY